MSEMDTILREVKVKPINMAKSFTIFDYYTTLTEFDRQSYDNIIYTDERGLMTYDKKIPIVSNKVDVEKLKRFALFAKKFCSEVERAANPIAVPAGCRCCLKGKKRTSCGLFYSLIFGEVK